LSRYTKIYTEQCELYEELVSKEDYEGNLLTRLSQLVPLSGRLVEFGAGTGRLTRLLAPHFDRVWSFDESGPMLAVARRLLAKNDLDHVIVKVAQHSSVPCPSEQADLAIEGWAFGHLVTKHGAHWRRHVGAAIDEMERVLKPGGYAVCIETLGTGRSVPSPPSDGLSKLYSHWVEDLKFQHTWVRTDYRFDSVAQAERLTRFFFGDELADLVRREKLCVVTECTGLWWKQKGL
jgi:SAM-dependent methyltransferase